MTTSKLGETSEVISENLTVVTLPNGKELHTFKNPEDPNTGKRYLVEWETEELTSLCPVTGHPDFCHLQFRYIPRYRCAELKSIKFYIESFRNEGHFYEELITSIYNDFDELLFTSSSHLGKAKGELQVIGSFNIRGGIPQVVTVGTIDYDLL